MTTAYHAKYYANALTLLRGGSGTDKLSRSLFDATVDLNPHQIEAALFALQNPTSKGVILADEVGLGKTIEAGLILCQLWAEGKRRLIVVCPASLRKQWALELEEKFNLPSRILEARSYKQLKNQGRINPFDNKEEIIITSYHFAARLADDLFPIVWDLAVIDEAHKLRNVYKKDNKIGKALKLAFTGRRKALLTATPLQNSLLEIYGLSLFIDDHLFGDLSAFKSQYVNAGTDNLAVLAGRLQRFSLRTLRKDVQEYIPYTDRKALTVPFEPSDTEMRLYDAVTAFMGRSRSIALPAQQRQLTTLIMRKLLASSSTAIEGTLRTIEKRLQDIKDGIAHADSLLENLIASDDLEEDYLEDDLANSDTSPIDKDLLDEELGEIEALATHAHSIKIDEKTKALIIALDRGFAEMAKMNAPKKALIFTESRRTQKYLREYLTSHGFKDKIVTFAGTNTDDVSKATYNKWLAVNKNTGRATGSKPVDMRTALVDRFKETDAEIMIATEAAAEGINLQFC
ncbi:MAG: DEAD/DEAH box helicase family protein, partial [Flavobacteriaceae bacterium]|nr:DEAD/DEAH box helicase family protein [Flavobacteriaceae bacterium]